MVIKPIPDIQMVDCVGPEIPQLHAVHDGVRHGHHHLVAEKRKEMGDQKNARVNARVNAQLNRKTRSREKRMCKCVLRA